jgi:predicted phage tail protein
MKQKTMADFIIGLSLNTNSFKATMTTAPSNIIKFRVAIARAAIKEPVHELSSSETKI